MRWLPRSLLAARRRAGPLLPVALVLGFCCLLLLRDPHFFWNDDYQVYHLPALRDIARSWKNWELPLVSLSSWYGGALAGEYQHATFSVFENLVVILIWSLDLTLPATAAVYSMIHLGLLAAGTFLLARHRGATADLATLAAVVACLNGWIITWGASDWISTLVSFAWVPWAWWALERSLDDRRPAVRFLPAGLFIYLILAAGWPFSAAMIGIVTVFLALRAGLARRRLAVLWPLVAAWAWGAALALPAILMFAEHLGASLRSGHQWLLEWQWVVPPSAILGLVMPYYTTEWFGWETTYDRPAVELACGLLPPIVLAAAILRRRSSFLRAWRWDLLALGLVLLLTVLPSVAPFRFSYRWLPLFHLILGLLAAQALSSLRADDASRAAAPPAAAGRFGSFGNFSSSDIVLATLGFLILETGIKLLLSGLLLYLGHGFQGLGLVVALLVLVPLWAWLRKPAAAIDIVHRWLPCFVVLVSLGSTYSLVSTRWVKRWHFPEALRRAEPLATDVRYLSLYNKQEAYRTDPGLALLIRPGNTAMLSGVELLNGYSPYIPAAMAEVLEMRYHLGFSSDAQARRILELEAGPDGLLRLMGVDGLVLAASFGDRVPALLETGWEMVFAAPQGAVLHRTDRRREEVRSIASVELVRSRQEIRERILKRRGTAVPRLLVDPGGPSGRVIDYDLCELELLRRSRLRVEARLDSRSADRPSLVVFLRAWYPGYRATLNGRDLPVRALNLVLPAVEVPAGSSGVLALEYAPATMRVGLAVSVLALVSAAGVAAASLRRRRRSATHKPAPPAGRRG